MKRIKALVLHEMKTLRWFLLLGIVAVCMFLFVQELILSYEDSYVSYGYMNGSGIQDPYHYSVGSDFSLALCGALWFAHMATVVLFAILVPIQFREYHRRKSSEYISSLPCTQREKFFVKLFSGYGVITICCMLLSIGVLIYRCCRIEQIYVQALLSPGYEEYLANETIWHTLRSLIMFWLVLIALYSIYAMMHSIVSNTIIAGILGCAMIGLPSWLCWLFTFMDDLFCLNLMDMDELGFRLAHVFWGMTTSIDGGGIGYSSLVAYDSMILIAAVLGSVIVICLVVSAIFSERENLAKAGVIIPNDKARIAISALLAIVLGTMGTWLIDYELMVNMLWVFVVVFLVVSTVLFLLLKKLFRLRMK